MSLEHFGTTSDGAAVHRLDLAGGGLTANILTWGAVLQDLRMVGHNFPLVLGFRSFDPYLNQSPYFGAIAGRFANRIGDAKFEIDGIVHHTDPNFLTKHTLHGGSEGCGKRIWSIIEQSRDHATLSIEDPDGWMGFPGHCTLTCTYRLLDPGVLRVELSAECAQPTIVNLAHHSYFNLDGSSDCRAHILSIASDHYVPVDDDMIPTGEVASVSGTAFDFREKKLIGSDLSESIIYDHNWCVGAKRGKLRPVATASSDRSNITLSVATTEPGLQFYAGHKISTTAPGLSGEAYGAYAGFCLETQNWPDAPNHGHFPNAILRPGTTLEQITEYQFSHL